MFWKTGGGAEQTLFLGSSPPPPYHLPHHLPQDLKGQLLIVLEHGACDTGSCLHAVSVSLGDTHIQLRDSGSPLLRCAPRPVLISPAPQGQPLTGPLFQGLCSSMGRMRACLGVGLRASGSPAPPPPSYCCAGLGPRSSGECLTLQPTSLWTPAMPTRYAGG